MCFCVISRSMISLFLMLPVDQIFCIVTFETFKCSSAFDFKPHLYFCTLQFERLSEWTNHGQHGAWAPWLLLRAVGVCGNCSCNRAPPLAQHRLRGLQHHYSHHLHERLVDGVCVAQHWHLPVWAVQISTGTATWPAGITHAPSG